MVHGGGVRCFDHGHVVVAEYDFEVGVGAPVFEDLTAEVDGGGLELGLAAVVVCVEEVRRLHARVGEE